MSPVQLGVDCIAQGHHFTLPALQAVQWGLTVNIMVTMLHSEMHFFPLSYPKLADEEASILQAHVALLLDDLLDSLENIPGHCNIPADVDVSSLLLQALVHRL